jgi:hypothetical protein
MIKQPSGWTALALCTLLLAGCKDKHEPLKPTVTPPAVQAPAPAV